MVEQKDSGRKDVGRTDKYSTGTPLEAYKKYREDHPNDNKEPRKIAHSISLGFKKPQHLGPKSLEMRKQELIAHIQEFQETFSNAEKKQWMLKKDVLVRALEE